MHTSSLEIILILLFAAVLVVAIFKRLNLSPVLGYLVAGIAIGPSGLKIINDAATTSYIAEFGIVFLLFYIGLELTFERLAAMKRYILGFGGVQILVTGAVISYIAHWFGLGVEASVLIGGGLALSSTAIVLQVLMERGEQSTQVGRLSLAVLIAQDFAVVPLLVMVTLLAQNDVNIAAVALDAFIKAALAIACMIAVGRLLLRPIFHAIGSLRSRELFAATTLFIVLGASYITEHFGLSLALGAFMAGLMVAETEYCHQVEADILPFKSLLLGLFFITVGMQIDFELLSSQLSSIVLLAIALVAVKAFIIIAICLLFRFSLGAAINAGLLLSQGGEFAFILFGLATTQGLIETHVSQVLLVTVTITMAITPLLAMLGRHISEWFEKGGQKATLLGDIQKENQDIDRHIIIVGFGKIGRNVCRIVSKKNINFIVVDSDAKNVHVGRQKNYPVFYGSLERAEVLSSVGIERAIAVVIAIDDPQEGKRIVSSIHEHVPDIPIIARGKDRTHALELESLGATFAIAEAFEISLHLGGTILKALGEPEPEIERVLDKMRAGNLKKEREEILQVKEASTD